ncbi:MAG: mannonate dehydratase [Acidobacteria bacterium]|nr:mannonate dehydratase [Acidobacteriota bacterium]
MNRRQVIVTSAAAAAPRMQALGAQPPMRMKLGTQHTMQPADLKILAALGVTHICGTLPSRNLDQHWTVDALKKLRESVESAGIQLTMLPLPLSSSVIEKAEYPSLLLGKSPERERATDEICEMIRNCAGAGIPALKYNMSTLGVVRTAPTRGRGGAQYSTFKYSDARQEPLSAAAPMGEDLYWERITWFLERVVPVANEFKVRLACHPHDPGMPRGKGYRGVETVLGSVDGLKRFVSIKESPYHGLNFCQGTVTEMLQDPSREIAGVIGWFGSRKKIFNVHFRNIQGRFLDFRETFPDDGDINMLDALRAYRATGYDGMLMPDHVPRIEGDNGGRQAFAYCFGYIRALMQLLEREA